MRMICRYGQRIAKTGRQVLYNPVRLVSTINDTVINAIERGIHLDRTTLDLSNQKITDGDIKVLMQEIRRYHKLETLILSCNHISDSGVKDLALALRSNPGMVTSLHLDNNLFSDEGAEKLISSLLHHEASLKSLNLRGNKFTDKTVELIAFALRENSVLTQLNLSVNHLSDVTAVELARALEENETLRTLSLRGNQISDRGVVSLAAMLHTNSTLTTICLGCNKLSGYGASMLGQALAASSSLSALYLGLNSISDTGVHSLAIALQKNSNLKTLSLRGNHITDEGAEELAKMLLVNSAITTLHLGMNEISDLSAKSIAMALRENPSLKLKRLNLSGNRIGDDGAMELALALASLGPKGRPPILDLSHNRLSPRCVEEVSHVLDPRTGNVVDENLALYSEFGCGVGSQRRSPQSLLDLRDDHALKKTEMIRRAFAMVYGIDGAQQNFEKAFVLFEKAQYGGCWPTAIINLAWMYCTGCGTPVSTEKAKRYLEYVIEHSHHPNALFLLADILAASKDPSDLMRARQCIEQIPKNDDLYQRAQWLLPFIDDQLERYAGTDLGITETSRPDLIMDAEIQIIAMIGQGHYGKVFLAKLQQERWVAVKYMSVDLVQQDDATLVRHVLRERSVCQQVASRHIPNVVKYVGFVDDLGNMHRGLVFELCADISDVEEEAEEMTKSFVSARFADLNMIPDWSKRVRSSLRSMVVRAPYRRWSAPKVVSMLRKVAEAILAVHSLGVLHQDIADRNVLCDEDGNVQLADFGLAKVVGSEFSGRKYEPLDEYSRYLTPGHQYPIAWWAPECLGRTGQKPIFSTNSDVYSLGILMWQCFAHRDPFDHIRPLRSQEEDDASACEEIINSILGGERPDLRLVDKDTPESLMRLISRCWETDPNARPTVSEIVEELLLIEKEPPQQSASVVVRQPAKLKQKWSDHCKIYWEMPYMKMKESAKKSQSAPALAHSFDYQMWLLLLEEMGHEIPPSDTLGSHLVNRLPGGRRPHDVFLVHAGEQKATHVASMAALFRSRGLRCFLDKEMGPGDGSPVEVMRSALETCRHAVVIISQDFLRKRDPTDELKYSSARMKWLREHQKWESLWVVLFDISVEDYNKARRRDPSLPDLGRSNLMLKWTEGGGGGYESWPHMCNVLKVDIVHEDKEKGAVAKWKSFLDRQWSAKGSTTFPLASNLYPQRRE